MCAYNLMHTWVAEGTPEEHGCCCLPIQQAHWSMRPASGSAPQSYLQTNAMAAQNHMLQASRPIAVEGTIPWSKLSLVSNSGAQPVSRRRASDIPNREQR